MPVSQKNVSFRYISSNLQHCENKSAIFILKRKPRIDFYKDMLLLPFFNCIKKLRRTDPELDSEFRQFLCCLILTYVIHTIICVRLLHYNGQSSVCRLWYYKGKSSMFAYGTTRANPLG